MDAAAEGRDSTSKKSPMDSSEVRGAADPPDPPVAPLLLTRFFQLCISIARRFTFVAGHPPPESNHPPPINFNNNNNQHYSVVDVVDQIDDPILETTPIGGDVDDGIGIERSVVADEREPPPVPLPPEDKIGIERSVVVEKEQQPQPPLVPPQQTQSSKSGSKNNKKESLGPYNREMKILLVGEGDFSFSAGLATAFGDAPNIVATSLNSIKFLRKNYANVVTNIIELTSRGCTVIHGVDATKMARHPQLWSHKFDRIVFNFPHAGFFNLKASREEQIRGHQALVKGFVKNAKKMIKVEDGQIHITHKCVGFYLKWDLETLGSSQRLRLVQETSFNVKHYPGYATKHGFGGDGDFDSRPSKTDIFQLLKKKKKASLGPYSAEQKILLVGEGDFSFSASLAVAFRDASNIVATSLNSKKFLRTNYANAGININELTSRGCKVIHGVDATKMARHPQLWSHKFDCIVFNFPHAGFSNLKASREEQIREHQALVKGFLKNAKKIIKVEDGQIHITHKCVGFFLKWDLETLGSSQRLRLVQETPFNVKQYPGYATKYGFGGDGDFDWRPSKTYKFQLLK